MADSVKANPDDAPLDEHKRVLVEFAKKLTQHPAGSIQADVERLRQSGYSDSAIHDAVACAAYFNFVNRVDLALGVEVESCPASLRGRIRRTRR